MARAKATKKADVLRAPAEVEYAEELAELAKADKDEKPEGWKLSPRAVRTYVLGGKAGKKEIRPKYLGNQRLIEIAIATLATDRALLLAGEPGTAKCVKGDTLIVDVSSGERVTVADAYKRQQIQVASLSDDFRLFPQRSEEVMDNGIRRCYRVTTHLGREIEITLNHPLLTLEGWKRLGELGVGDRIALPRSLPYFGTGELDDARVRLLGHLIAEGCLTQNLPYFSNNNPDVKEDFSNAVEEAYPDLKANWYRDGKMCSISGGRRGPNAKNTCTEWLRSLGLMGADSSTKFIPKVVFTLPKRQIALFLSRLFGGDGCVQKRKTTNQVTIDYASKSKRLIQDVQHLLLRFGINARYSVRRTGHYRLYIQGGEQCLLFLREIGLFGRSGVAEAIEHLEEESSTGNPNLDVVPCEVWPRIEQAAQNAGYLNSAALVKADRGVTYKGGGPRYTQSISRPRLSRLAELTENEQLSNIASSDIYWDRIESIEDVGEHRVYDLCMPEAHNFVANDIIVHNSWLSEHLTAAICGDSLQVVQGTAGTTEEQVRYSWNYAVLLAKGPSPQALVPSPIYRSMEDGKIVRFEEVSRVPSEVQDSLITLLSEKMMAVPELADHRVNAQRGFNLIATANTRDRGVNDMSSALTRRFNKVMLPVPTDIDTEVEIVQKRVGEISTNLKLPSPPPAEVAVRKIVQIFQELRRGQTLDGKQKVKQPSGVLSTAEAISLFGNSMALAGHFGNGKISDHDLAASLHGIVVKEEEKDSVAWVEYLENVMKKRGSEWRDLYSACKELAD